MEMGYHRQNGKYCYLIRISIRIEVALFLRLNKMSIIKDMNLNNISTITFINTTILPKKDFVCNQNP